MPSAGEPRIYHASARYNADTVIDSKGCLLDEIIPLNCRKSLFEKFRDSELDFLESRALMAGTRARATSHLRSSVPI